MTHTSGLCPHRYRRTAQLTDMQRYLNYQLLRCPDCGHTYAIKTDAKEN